MLKQLKQCLIDVTSFGLLISVYSQSILLQHTNNFGFVFPYLDDRIYKTKFLTHTRILFPLCVCHVTSAFPLTLKTFLLFVTVAISSRYQSPVNCSRNVEGKFMHTVIYMTIVVFQAWNLCSYLKHRGLSVSRSRKW